MITILFDIDGTLLRSGGAGLIAIEHVMRQMFGIQRIASVQVHGRTDSGILSDLFDHQSLSFEDHRDEFNQGYWKKLPETLAQCEGCLLPGVKELLETLEQNDDVALGILTGNSQRAAEIKLQHFQIHDYFDFGGYGDVHSDRNDVAALARRSAELHLGDAFDPSRLWVVGDTVNDIVCAQSIDSRVVAVQTGGVAIEPLVAAKPDVMLTSLADTAAFLQAIDVEENKLAD